MAINISNLGGSHAPKHKVETQEQVKKEIAQNSVSQSQAKMASKDSVSITPQARQLGQLQESSSKEPVINQKKVDELRKAITSGDYKINPEKLAASIAEFEFKLNEK